MSNERKRAVSYKPFHVVGLGTFSGAHLTAQALGITFNQFEYRWYKLGFRSKEQFDNYRYRSYEKEKDTVSIQLVLNNWRSIYADC